MNAENRIIEDARKVTMIITMMMIQMVSITSTSRRARARMTRSPLPPQAEVLRCFASNEPGSKVPWLVLLGGALRSAGEGAVTAAEVTSSRGPAGVLRLVWSWEAVEVCPRNRTVRSCSRTNDLPTRSFDNQSFPDLASQENICM